MVRILLSAVGAVWGFKCAGFEAESTQECLERLFLRLQVGRRVDVDAEVVYSLFRVPWSESEKKILTLSSLSTMILYNKGTEFAEFRRYLIMDSILSFLMMIMLMEMRGFVVFSVTLMSDN